MLSILSLYQGSRVAFDGSEIY